MGTYASVLHVLGLDGDLDLIARNDTFGRNLQDATLPQRSDPERRRKSRENSSPRQPEIAIALTTVNGPAPSNDHPGAAGGNRPEHGGTVTSDELVALISLDS